MDPMSPSPSQTQAHPSALCQPHTRVRSEEWSSPCSLWRKPLIEVFFTRFLPSGCLWDQELEVPPERSFKLCAGGASASPLTWAILMREAVFPNIFGSWWVNRDGVLSPCSGWAGTAYFLLSGGPGRFLSATNSVLPCRAPLFFIQVVKCQFTLKHFSFSFPFPTSRRCKCLYIQFPPWNIRASAPKDAPFVHIPGKGGCVFLLSNVSDTNNRKAAKVSFCRESLMLETKFHQLSQGASRIFVGNLWQLY